MEGVLTTIGLGGVFGSAVSGADAAGKAADVHIEFVDRFTGCLLFTGEVSSVETGLLGAVSALESVLGFVPAPITRT